MIYKAKEGSKAYEYIKSVCEAEDRELEAYFKRCKEAVGFEFKQFGGYTPDSTMIHSYLVLVRRCVCGGSCGISPARRHRHTEPRS